MGENFFHNEKDLKKMGVNCGKKCKIHCSVIITHPKNLYISSNVRIDSFTTIVNPNKVKIENFVHIGSHALLHAGSRSIELKEHSGVSSGVKIFTHTDDYTGNYYYGPYNKKKNSGSSKKITLKKYCILGTNCVVTPNAEFGEGSVAGAQTLVNIKLKDWTIYQGFPLRGYFKRKKKFLKNLKRSLNDFV